MEQGILATAANGPAVQQAVDEGNKKAALKNIPCRHYLMAKCTKSKNCRFFHLEGAEGSLLSPEERERIFEARVVAEAEAALKADQLKAKYGAASPEASTSSSANNPGNINNNAQRSPVTNSKKQQQQEQQVSRPQKYNLNAQSHEGKSSKKVKGKGKSSSSHKGAKDNTSNAYDNNQYSTTGASQDSLANGYGVAGEYNPYSVANLNAALLAAANQGYYDLYQANYGYDPNGGYNNDPYSNQGGGGGQW